MYVLKGKAGKLSSNFLLETKDVEKHSDMRESEELWMRAAVKFFEAMSRDAFTVTFKPQLKRDDNVVMIKQLVIRGQPSRAEGSFVFARFR
ncbi:hypothetical protein ASF68_11620 [Plantibacter sp. Leaf314]|nr:hypothetical protein ASF68_11620 [Plantibacter sp. Leaf314]